MFSFRNALRAMLLALLAVQVPVGLTEGLARPANVDQGAWNKVAGGETVELLIKFKAQADLAPAFGMSWEERGEYVVAALTETAAQSQAAAKRLLAGHGLGFESFINGNEMIMQTADAGVLSALAALSDVDWIRETTAIELPPLTPGALPLGPVTWGLNDTKATDFWTAFGVKGDGVVVANIDTGVQWNHPALVNQFKCNDPTDAKCWRDPSNVCGVGGACDNNGHGTHTMGTMVADDDPALAHTAGMAPNARWIACKGCESNSCSDFALNACADWILAPGGSSSNRPHIVNNSWGGGGGDNWYLGKVNAWRAAGIFPAFSAGNSGPGCNSLGSPGDYQESVASAAHDSNRNIASFSSRGPSVFGHDPYTKPNISAPGVSVTSTVPGGGWASFSGTSMASPHTAGAVALLWSCDPSLIGQIDPTAELLQNNADGPPPAGNCGAPPDGEGNYTYGYGYLNVLAAGDVACGGVSRTMHVDDVMVAPFCRMGRVVASVRVVDQDEGILPGATVAVKWVQPDGATAEKATNSKGKAVFLKKASVAGTYELCVENLTKTGYTYAPADNVETCAEVAYNPCR